MRKSFLSVLFFWIFIGAYMASAGSLELIDVQPQDGSTVYSSRPKISIEFKDAENLAQTLKNVRIELDGEDISPMMLRMGRYLIYVPEAPLSNGKHRLGVECRSEKDASCKIISFDVALPRLIKSISHNGLEPLVADDILEVVMDAPPGGRADFSFGDLLEKFPMSEIKPGIYKGAYKIPFGEMKSNARLTGYYTSPSGKIDMLESEQPLNIQALFFKVHITSPRSGTEVNNYFSIEGKTRPNSRVYVIPSASIQGLDTGTSGSGGGSGRRPGGGSSTSTNMGTITADADKNGDFKVFYGFPLRIKGMKFNFTIYADDPDGNRSLYDTFWVRVK
ncbi:MAG: hypothetical protein M1269_00290 [Chloroflexi bacterium]|nr:hypothetical protein [Chloroflexota bacterium]